MKVPHLQQKRKAADNPAACAGELANPRRVSADTIAADCPTCGILEFSADRHADAVGLGAEQLQLRDAERAEREALEAQKLEESMAKAKAAADEASRLEAEEADFLASPDGAKWKKELDARRAAQLEADRLEAIKIRIAGKGTA